MPSLEGLMTAVSQMAMGQILTPKLCNPPRGLFDPVFLEEELATEDA
jgi:hypothetical protein